MTIDYNQGVRRIIAILLFVGGHSAVLPADTVTDAAKAELARERKLLATDTKNLSEISRRLESALNQLASASRAVADAAVRSDAGTDELARREDAVSSAEQEVHSVLDKRRLLVDRVVERRRSIAALEAEIVGKKPPDVLSGRWTVIVEPGEQKGVFRVTLDGTIVSGEYSLEGGYSGSLRGTLVSDRLRLERVDSKLGFSTIYYGRVAREGTSISGTWEATNFGGGAPGSGRWKAVREEDKEDSP